MTAVVDRSSALRARLFGGTNRVIWSATDIERVMRRFGISVRANTVDALARERAVFRSLPAIVARRFRPPAGAMLYKIVCSDGSVDRCGDLIEQNGWELGAYKARPIMLFQHNSELLPVGGALSIEVTGGKLRATVAFASPEKNELAAEVQASVDAGLLSGISVGFRPLEWAWRGDGLSIRFISSELMENSWVSIPANANCGLTAIVDSAKSIEQQQPTPKIEAMRAGFTGMSVETAGRRLEQIRARARR